jgi:ubiquinone/menaquinone biosynthesis C-methylase UbiE
MSDQHAAFVGSIPENYDRYLGPCLFEDYAADIANRVNVPDGGAVLEIACGTGIVTRKLRDSLPASARLVATDLNEAMIAYAKHKFQSNESVEFKQADATELPFADSSFDAVVCQFGLMFFPDKDRAMREVHRVLKPGGVYVFNVWDAIEENELPQIANDTVCTFFEQDPPTFYQVPFGLHDKAVIQKLLDGAGFEDAEMLVLAKTSMSPSAADAAKGLIEGNPVIVEINQRATSSVEAVEAAVAAAVTARFGDNPVRSNLQAIVCTARR